MGTQHFVFCIDNTDHEASLIRRKAYEVVPDAQAKTDDLIRIIDESGEDYLYHISHFIFVDLPTEGEQARLGNRAVKWDYPADCR